MESWLEDGDAVVLEHVEESRLSGVIETKEEELRMLVGET